MISHVAGEPTFWEEGGREEGTASSGVNLAFLPHAWYLVSTWREATMVTMSTDIMNYGEGKIESVRLSGLKLQLTLMLAAWGNSISIRI